MMKKNKLYITNMYRWGEYDNHCYQKYVGFSKAKAIDVGKEEMEKRGGKYGYAVDEYTPGDISSHKRIVGIIWKC